MTFGPALALALAAFVGAMLAAQSGINAQLGRHLGHPLWATFVSFLTGTVAIVPLLIFFKVPAPTVTLALGGPWWIWIGGLLGVCFVTAALTLAPMTGIAVFLAAMVAGQLISSLVIDNFGLVGLAVRPVTLARAAGMGLIIAGVLVMQLDRS